MVVAQPGPERQQLAMLADVLVLPQVARLGAVPSVQPVVGPVREQRQATSTINAKLTSRSSFEPCTSGRMVVGITEVLTRRHARHDARCSSY